MKQVKLNRKQQALACPNDVPGHRESILNGAGSWCHVGRRSPSQLDGALQSSTTDPLHCQQHGHCRFSTGCLATTSTPPRPLRLNTSSQMSIFCPRIVLKCPSLLPVGKTRSSCKAHNEQCKHRGSSMKLQFPVAMHKSIIQKNRHCWFWGGGHQELFRLPWRPLGPPD